MAGQRLRIVGIGEPITAEPGDEITVGSDAASNIRVADPRVAHQHLRLRQDDSGWWVEAGDDRHLTYVDGAAVTRHPVRHETFVRLADPSNGPWLRLTPVVASGATTPASVTRIGRAPDNDLVLDDLSVSRYHAELRRFAGGECEIVDNGSFNGTIVNGRAIEATTLRPLDVVTIGLSQFRFIDNELQRHTERDEVALAALDIGVRSRGTMLVSGISFPAAPGSLTAIVGPSGAGKSTLLGVLSGARKPDQGSVLFNGSDIHANFEHFRQQIGFVPQLDIVHPELTVRRSLEYAAELRFPPDVSKEERRKRIDEVLAELGLGNSADLAVRQLSGGQRKRLSIGVELLTRPALLILDEPTSGLDPGLERSVMELLRSLAGETRVVLVVTHSIDSLNLCDRVLLLASGGRTAFFGPPQLAMGYFDRNDYQEVFRDVSDGDAPRWGDRFQAHVLGARYVAEPLEAASSAGPDAVAKLARPLFGQWLRQYAMVARRTARVLAGDRVTLLTSLVAAPLLGLLAFWALPGDQLAMLPPGQLRLVSQAAIVLFVPVFGMTIMGLSNGIREISREVPIVRREQDVGLSASAYVAGKASVLAGLTVVQALIFVPLAIARQGDASSALLLGSARVEIVVAAALSGLAGLATGLLISALLRSTPAALASLPLVLIFHVLCGAQGVFPDSHQPLLKQVSYASSARWGLAAVAATTDLNHLQQVNAVAQNLPNIDLSRPQAVSAAVVDIYAAAIRSGRGDSLFAHTRRSWLFAAGVLLAETAVLLAATVIAVRRIGTR